MTSLIDAGNYQFGLKTARNVTDLGQRELATSESQPPLCQ